MIERVYADEEVTLYHGDAVEWPGDEAVDLVLTNPYGPMPASLRRTPQILHQWSHRKHELERWAGLALGELQLLGTWNDGRESFWCANMEPFDIDIEHFRPEPGGWYPLELPIRILQGYVDTIGFGKKITVWDGFMGRATVGRAAAAMRQRYVGVEQLAIHIEIAAKYLDLAGVHVTT